MTTKTESAMTEERKKLLELRKRHKDETLLTHQIRCYAEYVRSEAAHGPNRCEIAGILSAHASYISEYIDELSRTEAPLPEEVREIEKALNTMQMAMMDCESDAAASAMKLTERLLRLWKSSQPRLTEDGAGLDLLSDLLWKAHGAAQKLRAELSRSGRTMYGAAEVDWLIDACDKFYEAKKYFHSLYDRLTSQGEAPPSPERLPGGTHMSRYKTAEDYERIAEARAQGEAPPAVAVVRDASTELTRLRAQLQEMREALKPFADQADKIPQGQQDWHYWPYHFTVGNIRRAAAALTQPPGGETDVSRPSSDLDATIKEAVTKFNAMSPEEQAEHRRLQRESWVRGEMGLGPE